MPDTTLVNLIPVDVVYRDGKKETIALGELSIRKLYEWMKHYAAKDTPALVALSADRPIEWIDRLTRESFQRLAEAAMKANFQAAAELVRTDPVALALFGPALLELEAVVKKAQAIVPPTPTPPGPSGPTSSPAPAPSVSPAATGSV